MIEISCLYDVLWYIKSNMDTTFQYNVIFRTEPEGGFTAIVPSLPGCVSFGKSIVEAKNMILDAIKGYVISLRKHGEPVPSDNESFVNSISIPKSFAARLMSSEFMNRLKGADLLESL